MNISHHPIWLDLASLADQIKQQPLSDLFKQDDRRYQKFSRQDDDLTLDFSKQRVDQAIMAKLLELAEQQDLTTWIERLFNGDHVNNTENRPALHTALRSPKHKPYRLGDKDISQLVHQNLSKLEAIVDNIHSGQWRGYSGEPIQHVVNIGVGGSDLGPLMACHALPEHHPPQPAFG